MDKKLIPMKKKTFGKVVKVDYYGMLSDAVENGIGWQISRCNKYASTRLTGEQEALLIKQGHHEIMNQICEYFRFEDNEY